MNVKFRPHHFLCTIGFKGKGYSDGFIQNFKDIKKFLEENPETLIEVTRHTDSICGPCPNKRSLNCETQDKIEHLDHEHQKILQIKEGDLISWKEAKILIREKFTVKNMAEACSKCSWKALGICEEALLKLKN